VPGHFHHTQDASMGHDHQHVPVIASERIRPSGDTLVDTWIDALQDGDDAAARRAQQALANSIDRPRPWRDVGPAMPGLEDATGQGPTPPDRRSGAEPREGADLAPPPFASHAQRPIEPAQAMER